MKRAQSKAVFPPKKARNGNIELLRFLMALSVLVLHTVFGPLPHNDIWSCLAINLAVPTFIVISGWFLINKKSRWLRSVCAIVAAIISVLPINVILHFYGTGYSKNWDFLKIFYNFYTFKISWWYLYIASTVFALSPLIHYGIKDLNKWLTLSVIMFIVLLSFNETLTSNFARRGVFHFYEIIALSAYYSLGCWIKLYLQPKIEEIRKVKIVVCFLSSLIVLTTLALMVITSYFKIKIPLFLFYQAGWNCFFTVADAVALVLLFNCINIKNRFVNKIFNFLGEITMGVYLCQGFAMDNMDFIPGLDATTYLVVFMLISIAYALLTLWPMKYLTILFYKYSLVVFNKLKTTLHK